MDTDPLFFNEPQNQYFQQPQPSYVLDYAMASWRLTRNWLILLTLGVLAAWGVGIGAYFYPEQGSNNFRCRSDLDCLDMSLTDSCENSFCNITTGYCFTDFINNATCSTTSDCEGPTDICRNCQCIPGGAEPPCTEDSQCTNYEGITACYISVCNQTTQSCDAVFNANNTCAGDDSLCGDGEVCRDCECVDLCEGVVCESDACKELTCDQNSGECIVIDVVENCCTNSSSCGEIEWSMCLEKTCGANNTCDDVIIDGFDCAIDSNCLNAGEICEDCICVQSPNGLVSNTTVTSTGALTQDINLLIYRNDDIYTARFSGFSGTSLAEDTIDLVGIIPVSFRPFVDLVFPVQVFDNNLGTIGSIAFNMNGDASLRSGGDDDAFQGPGGTIGSTSGIVIFNYFVE